MTRTALWLSASIPLRFIEATGYATGLTCYIGIKYDLSCDYQAITKKSSGTYQVVIR